MSTRKTWVTIIVIIVIIIIGSVLYATSSSKGSNPAQNQQSTNQASAAAGVNPSAPTDTSNAGLQQDMNAVDNQMNNLNTDTSNADQGMSSSPTPTAQ